MKLASLPVGMNWKNLYGAGILAGIGFTMSLFIAGLAFADLALLDLSKIGVLFILNHHLKKNDSQFLFLYEKTENKILCIK